MHLTFDFLGFLRAPRGLLGYEPLWLINMDLYSLQPNKTNKMKCCGFCLGNCSHGQRKKQILISSVRVTCVAMSNPP